MPLRERAILIVSSRAVLFLALQMLLSRDGCDAASEKIGDSEIKRPSPVGRANKGLCSGAHLN